MVRDMFTIPLLLAWIPCVHSPDKCFNVPAALKTMQGLYFMLGAEGTPLGQRISVFLKLGFLVYSALCASEFKNRECF